MEGQDASLVSEVGLEAWSFSNDSGVMRLMASDLNFFAVVHIRANGMRRVMLQH
jgi:hypothetical protein